MRTFQKLKEKEKQLIIQVISLYYAYQHPKVGIFPKLIIAFTIGYALSPIDLIPDFIPVLGHLDDLIIIPALVTLSIKLMPEDIMIECRTRANIEPIQLKKNWVFGTIFIALWILLLTFILVSIIKVMKK